MAPTSVQMMNAKSDVWSLSTHHQQQQPQPQQSPRSPPPSPPRTTKSSSASLLSTDRTRLDQLEMVAKEFLQQVPSSDNNDNNNDKKDHRERIWNEHYRALIQFQLEHGHCRLPTKHPSYYWAYAQCTQRYKGILSLEREMALNKIHFEWNNLGRAASTTTVKDNNNNATNNDNNKKRKIRGSHGSNNKRQATKKNPKRQVTAGTRVAVYWSDDDEYYPGTVTGQQRSDGAFHVLYDDGEQEWVSPDDGKYQYRICNDDAQQQQQQQEEPTKVVQLLPTTTTATSTTNPTLTHTLTHASKLDLLQQITPGTRVSVWWPAEQKYYLATVKKLCCDGDKPHYLWYDDGDSEKLNLLHRKFQLVHPLTTKITKTAAN